jgi:hypothetical protein
MLYINVTIDYLIEGRVANRHIIMRDIEKKLGQYILM